VFAVTVSSAVEIMISVPIHRQDGSTTGENYEFDPAELAPAVNKQLLHDAVVMYQANLRVGTQKSKTRSEVSGSSHKLYKQKGTGRARMGNKRTPVRRGGGHAFAKRPRDFGFRMPKKALRLATRMALLGKFQDGEVVVLDQLSIDAPRTKVVAQMLKGLGVEGQSCLLATVALDQNTYRSARNIPDVSVKPAGELNAFELLRRRRLVVTRDALDRLRGVAGGKE
jgi:large subunit ribosomal protein L4